MRSREVKRGEVGVKGRGKGEEEKGEKKRDEEKRREEKGEEKR